MINITLEKSVTNESRMSHIHGQRLFREIYRKEGVGCRSIKN